MEQLKTPTDMHTHSEFKQFYFLLLLGPLASVRVLDTGHEKEESRRDL